MIERAPTGYRISLGKELRALREAAGLTREAVPGFSQDALSRIEAGKRVPRAADLEGLLSVYGADAKAADSVRLIAQNARRRGQYGRVSDWVKPYLGLESDAVDLAMYCGDILPGLIQTEDYARALIGTSLSIAPADVDDRVTARLRRGALLTGENPPTVHIVLGQAAILYAVGGAAAMADQISRVIELAGFRHITVQIVPFCGGAHAALGNRFTILTASSDGERSEWVYTERLDGADLTPNSRTVRLHRMMFKNLMVNALSERESMSLLEKTRDEHRRTHHAE